MKITIKILCTVIISILAGNWLTSARFENGFSMSLHPEIESRINTLEGVSEIFKIKSILPFYSDKFDYIYANISVIMDGGGLWHGSFLIKKKQNDNWNTAKIIESNSMLDISIVEYLNDDEITRIISNNPDDNISDLIREFAIIPNGDSADSVCKKMRLLALFRKGVDLDLDSYDSESEIKRINNKGSRPIDFSKPLFQNK